MTPVEQKHREQVRMLAAAWFERGAPITQVARALRVSARQVRKWHHTWEHDGVVGLRSKGPLSAPRLSPEQFARLEGELRRGSGAHGWVDDQRWTLERIVTLVWRLFHIGYTRAGMSLLLHRNGWTVQVPVRRATQRDEAAVETWVKQDWPRVKPPRRSRTPGCASRTSPVRA